MEVSEMRKQKRDHIQMIPKNMPSEEGLVIVDTTWGMIQDE